jgi:hypothetical protein
METTTYIRPGFKLFTILSDCDIFSGQFRYISYYFLHMRLLSYYGYN